MSKKVINSWVIPLIFGLALGICGLFIRIWLDPPVLTKRATRVAVFPPSQAVCEWKSDHQCIFFTLSPPTPLTQLDINNGTKSILSAFLKPRLNSLSYHNFAISPDGKNAFWGRNDSYFNGVKSMPLDGFTITKHKPSPRKFDGEETIIIWMADSKRWIQLIEGVQSDYAIIGGVDSPRDISQFPIAKPKGSLNGNQRGLDAQLLGVTSAGRVLGMTSSYEVYIPGDPNPKRAVRFFEISFDRGRASVREYNFNVTMGGEANEFGVGRGTEEICLSPAGDRLAWMMHARSEETTLSLFLARWIPSLYQSPHVRIELRTSKLDGTDMNLLGFVEAKPDPKDTWTVNPYGLRWLPGGKKLSFIYKNSLWTIPAGI